MSGNLKLENYKNNISSFVLLFIYTILTLNFSLNPSRTHYTVSKIQIFPGRTPDFVGGYSMPPNPPVSLLFIRTSPPRTKFLATGLPHTFVYQLRVSVYLETLGLANNATSAPTYSACATNYECVLHAVRSRSLRCDTRRPATAPLCT